MITYTKTTPMRVCEKVCKECPFKKGSPKGWLGPHSSADFLKMTQADVAFACHMKIKGKYEGDVDSVLSGKQKVCRGYMISAAKSFVRFGKFSPELAKLQEGFSASDKETSGIMDKNEFYYHHQ